ncbi:MAG: lysophospholipid acyltransferase family protein [Planctomycetota bacterium]
MARNLRKHAADYTAYLALRVAIALLQALPLAACERLAGGLAWLVGDRLGMRRRVLEENLRTAFPDWTHAQRQRCGQAMWRHLFLMVAEIAHTPRKMHRTNWRQRYDVPDVKTIVHTLLSSRAKVVICGHYGNFELGGYLLGLFGFPTHTVARPLDNPYVNRFVNEFRGRTGQYILPKVGSRDAIERVLDGGGTLALLGDQAAGEKACWVNFFGRPASTHKAVSLFTLSYAAPTLVLAAQRIGGPLRYRGVLGGAIDPQAPGFAHGGTQELTNWFTERLEGLIRGAPEQYWWVHRRWRSEPPERVQRRLAREREAAGREQHRGRPDDAAEARAAAGPGTTTDAA